MSRKTRRTLLKALSRVPGAYTFLAFLLARRVTVQGASMIPTLDPGERLLFDRLAYVWERPRIHDIVLVSHPLRAELRMIKRLAGVPGDAIEGRTLARGEYWVVGDNAGKSTDSREFGPVRRSDLLGRAWVRYWPTDRWRRFE
jgi:signal peptidase I